MIDINNKTALEGVFAENFASPYYPVLANLYLQEGDFRRAKKVCEVGLEHDSSNVDGKFILAKVALAENKLTIAEKWLKQVVVENPAHFIALRLLISLEIQLGRSPKTIEIYISQLLQFLPYDTECIHWLSEINSSELDGSPENTTPNSEIPQGKNFPNSTIETKPDHSIEERYDIVESMATFTMVQVLKSQKHYSQALAVLEILKSKERDSERISKEKIAIQQLLKEDIK